MLSLQEIEKYYPENIKKFKRSILREYLQYKILQIIFNSDYANKLFFLGGTALRIVHSNSRFSEDLDFDNFSLDEKEFNEIALLVKNQLELDGYEVEIKNVYKGAYRCYVRIPQILFNSGLSGHKKEKILIQLDTAPHGFHYNQDRVILNKFDIFTEINVTPLDIILAQKIFAIFNRKAMKGRDFFDVIFLFSLIKPNYEYLQLKMDIKNGEELKEKLLTLDGMVNFKQMASDVKPFLFNADDTKKVKLFMSYIKKLKL
ncbi:MAG: nucleotidyl transferase AbiEii/AbiGii toxin family protein [Patescibacteria group bacterium]|jgi:predicted nucleotidyltransferase component of viral defense system|nr:nucleotidyl transferase AbiEii/AbiGii toxin family protein [Patescibacteria group bacterium]